jgi:YVTN family beta-propeller protein
MASFAYVTNTGSQTLSVIDLATNTVVASPAVRGAPIRVALTPDGRRAYVTSRETAGGAFVSVLDTATSQVTDTIANVTDFFISGIAIGQDGARAYVASAGNDHTVKVLDIATNTVAATVPMDNSIDVAVAPDGRHVYVTSFEGVTVIDAAGHTVAAAIDVAKGSTSTTGRGLAFSPDGTKAYVTSGGMNAVAVIDTAARTVIATVGVGVDPVGIAVTPDGRRAYVANHGSGNVSVIDTGNNTETATIALGAEPFGVAVTADGGRVYVTSSGADTKNVSVIDTATNGIVARITAGSKPFAIAIGQPPSA